MKIGIVNTVAANSGDAAILLGAVELLRQSFGHDAEFVVSDRHGDTLARHYPNLDWRPQLADAVGSARVKRLGHGLRAPALAARADRARFLVGVACFARGLEALARRILTAVELDRLRECRSLDIVVSNGGTYLTENYKLSHRLLEYKVALALGRPLVLFTQSLGPFSKRRNRRALRRVFERAALVLLRDEESVEHIRDLRPRRLNAHVTADAAFAMPGLPAPSSARPAPLAERRDRRVAISVRAWRHFATVDPAVGRQRYIEALRAATTHLVECHGMHVTFVSTCQGVPAYPRDDSRLARRIVKALPGPVRSSVVVDGEFRTPVELARTMSSFDMLISTRMHAAIIGVMTGTPTFPIAYEFKTRALFERLGQGRWVQAVEELRPASLIEAIDVFIAEGPGDRTALAAAVQGERERAFEAVEELRSAHARSGGEPLGPPNPRPAVLHAR